MNAMGGTHKVEDERTTHGTQKPVECMARPIRNNSKEGDWVYDCFGGSGSTLIAAEILNRNCLMMELDPTYVSATIERWEHIVGEKAVKK
jgi:DNA modification methylase